MNDARKVTISKYLSKVLRHTPEALGLTLAEGGWVKVDDLLDAAAKHQFVITRAELDEVVASSDKQRFAFDPSGTQIRANQGHSTPVDLQLEPLVPPESLYHGTGQKSVAAIQREGVQKRDRHDVHLSLDTETAYTVGARHGVPVIFRIDAASMHRDGYLFYCSANGVWLTDHVPPDYLTLIPTPA